MRNQENYWITPLELSISLISMVVGVGILTLPRILAQSLDSSDGWISLILGGMATFFLVYVYIRLQKHFPGKNILQFLEAGKVGKWLAQGLSIGFILYFIGVIAFQSRILGTIVKLYLLDQTPTEILIMLFLLVTTYAVSKGVQGIIHLNLMFFPIVFFIFLAALLLNVTNIQIANILPVLSTGGWPILSEVRNTIPSFLGIELLLFWMAYMHKKEIRVKPFAFSIGFIIFVYTLTIVFCYTIYTVESVKYITFPMIEMAKEIEVPGAFIERLESILLVVWIMSIFNATAMTQLLLVQRIKTQFLKDKQPLLLMPSIAFLCFMTAFIPNSVTETFTYGNWVGGIGIALFLTSLFFGYLFHWLRGSRSKKQGG